MKEPSRSKGNFVISVSHGNTEQWIQLLSKEFVGVTDTWNWMILVNSRYSSKSETVLVLGHYSITGSHVQNHSTTRRMVGIRPISFSQISPTPAKRQYIVSQQASTNIRLQDRLHIFCAKQNVRRNLWRPGHNSSTSSLPDEHQA